MQTKHAISVLFFGLVFLAVMISAAVLMTWHDNPQGLVMEKSGLNSLILGANADTMQSTPDAMAQNLSLQQQVEQAGFTWGAPVFMRIFKQERQLEVWLQQHNQAFALFRSYPICSFSGELGPKLAEGDHQAPEGFYQVRRSALNPNSRYHLSFNLGFPNRYDRSHNRTGSYLMVHGDCVSVGCYAMTDAKIEEIYGLAEAAFNNGQTAFQVHAFPFHLTPSRLAEHEHSPWHDFWSNLQEGYLAFETNHKPPFVKTHNQRYLITAIP